MHSALNIHQGSTGDTTWAVASADITLDLVPYVRSLYGYVERTPGLLRRREFPAPQVVVIFELGPSIRVYESGQAERWSRFPGGFVAGIDDRFTLTEYRGEQRGVQLNLTPVGARLLFGIPMSELSGEVLSIGDVLPGGRELSERLLNCSTWQGRFELILDLLRQRLREVPARTQMLTWAFERIVNTGGALDVATLNRQLGYSHKHVLTLFQDQLGMSPKLLQRLVRFDGLVRQLKQERRSWVNLAAEFGFADQAHLVREVRHFSGVTPSQLARILSAPIVEEKGADSER